MRTFVREQSHPHSQLSPSVARSNAALSGPNHHANPLLHLQRTLGNHAVLGLLQTHIEQSEIGSITTAATRFAPDFRRTPESRAMQIQRATKWVGATVHEDLNLAEVMLKGGAPITRETLNGTIIETIADAEGAINAPTISTKGSGSDWKATVVTVPKQEGGDDETVLAPGPWETTVPKEDVRAKYGLAACDDAGDSTFSALGKPDDGAIYKANRRHEDRHVADDKVVFSQTVVKWDEKLEKAKKKGTTFKGTDAPKAEASLWAAMGGTPKDIARRYRSLSGDKGDDFHRTPKGGKLKPSSFKANPDCSASSAEVRSP